MQSAYVYYERDVNGTTCSEVDKDWYNFTLVIIMLSFIVLFRLIKGEVVMKKGLAWCIVYALLLVFVAGCNKEKEKYHSFSSNEVGAINEEIQKLATSPAYKDGDDETRVDLLKSLFDNISENGVELFPYSLIFNDSIVCHNNKIRVKYRYPEHYYVFIVSDNHIYQVYYDNPDSWEDENSQYTLSYVFNCYTESR